MGREFRPAPSRIQYGGFLLAYAILKRLARVERREAGRRDLDALARLRIAAFARLALACLERAEPGDLNFLSRDQRGRDQAFLPRREECVDDRACFASGERSLLGDGGDELRLIHFDSPPFDGMGRTLRPDFGGVKWISHEDADFSSRDPRRRRSREDRAILVRSRPREGS